MHDVHITIRSPIDQDIYRELRSIASRSPFDKTKKLDPSSSVDNRLKTIQSRDRIERFARYAVEVRSTGTPHNR
jgi:hypothetical protein